MNYIYRLNNEEGRPDRGMRGVFDDSNPDLKAYLQKHPDYQSLYIEVGEGRKELVQPPCVLLTREFSGFYSANATLVSRMLRLRTDWSRK